MDPFHQRPPQEKTRWGGGIREKEEKEVLLAVVSSSGALGGALGMAAVPVCV